MTGETTDKMSRRELEEIFEEMLQMIDDEEYVSYVRTWKDDADLLYWITYCIEAGFLSYDEEYENYLIEVIK